MTTHRQDVPRTVKRLFAAAQASPASPAVEDPGGVLTRSGLFDACTAVADGLMPLGPGGLVAVLADRDRTLPAALLGVHMAGCAYLPIDVALPDARVRKILGSVPVDAVLTSAGLAERVPSGMPVLDLGESCWVTPPPSHQGTGRFEGVAYLIHTSGTTGEPKCVEVGHDTLENHVRGLEDAVGEADSQVWQAVSSLGFDSHVTEFLAALSGGALVCLGPRDPLSLMEGPLSRGTTAGPVTHMQCTPSLLRLLVSDPATLSGLRRMEALLVGGEPFPVELLTKFEGHGVRILNVYGPTEATVWVATHEVTPADAAPVPIGTAIRGTTLSVLNDLGEPVPANGLGRLYVSGSCLARGYYNDPELTASKFVGDAGASGGRAYDTGDLASMDESGRVTVLGRVDNQVKVRGNRVELGEIEQTLRAHPLVEDAVVEPDRRPDARTLSALVASPEGVTVADLRDWVGSRLAEYQVPTRITVCEELPRTVAGKAARQLIPSGQPGPATKESEILA